MRRRPRRSCEDFTRRSLEAGGAAPTRLMLHAPSNNNVCSAPSSLHADRAAPPSNTLLISPLLLSPLLFLPAFSPSLLYSRLFPAPVSSHALSSLLFSLFDFSPSFVFPSSFHLLSFLFSTHTPALFLLSLSSSHFFSISPFSPCFSFSSLSSSGFSLLPFLSPGSVSDLLPSSRLPVRADRSRCAPRGGANISPLLWFRLGLSVGFCSVRILDVS